MSTLACVKGEKVSRYAKEQKSGVCMIDDDYPDAHAHMWVVLLRGPGKSIETKQRGRSKRI
jgi:hypothetical protein